MTSPASNRSTQLARICVLVSGSGSNLQAIMDATAPGQPLADVACVALVVANRANAYGLIRAREAGIPTYVHTLKAYRERAGPEADAGEVRRQFDDDLGRLLRTGHAAALDPTATEERTLPTAAPFDLVVLAGWMHILSPAFLDHVPGRVINLHPALPGEFDGIHAIERAYAAARGPEALKRTGVMVHKVVPEVDRGAPILTEEVPILPEDTLETLEARIHQVEHRLLVAAIAKLLPTLPSTQ